MSYAETTFSDRNPVKRWLQRKRLVTAVDLCQQRSPSPRAICDFGAGNGELCKRLSSCYPGVPITCYEPTPNHLQEARENLDGIGNISFCSAAGQIREKSFDLLVCLEVLEHLPPDELINTFGAMANALTSTGVIVVGVPLETGFPALYKGIFRMSRRYGAFDANVRNVTAATLGRPPRNRPVDEIAPGFKYHWEHMGFDFRALEKTLCEFFSVRPSRTGAWNILKSLVMPEVYFVVDRTAGALYRSC